MTKNQQTNLPNPTKKPNEFIQTPFNYTGSKYKLLPQLINKFDYRKSSFVDVFTGGGSIYTNVLDSYNEIYINDVILPLIDIHKQLISRGQSFVDEVKKYCVAKDDALGYMVLRKEFNATKDSARLFALMLCCTNNMMRFNKKFEFNQTFGKRSFNDSTQKKIDQFLFHVQPLASKINFMSKDFYLLKPNDISNIFFYLDPPYFNTEAGYNAYWSNSHEEKLYNYIKDIASNGASFAISGVMGNHKGKAESPVLSKLKSDGYNVIELEFDYNKVSKNKDAEQGVEVLITNY